MYLKNITIKNIGPIEKFTVDLPFKEDGNPKPIVFVGENGAGKTILQSQIIDGFYEIGNALFDNIGIHAGLKRSFYKNSGHTNLQTGKNNGFSLLRFIDNQGQDLEYFDKIGEVKHEDFISYVQNFALSPNTSINNQKEITHIDGVRKEKLRNEWVEGVHFYQPAYRYEEPFWKNDSFIDRTRFDDKKNFSGILNKELEIISSTKDNKSFLLDLVLDFEIRKQESDQIIWNNINDILRKIKKRNDIRLGIGPRGRYRVSIVEQDPNGIAKNQLLPSIDNLSLGESILFNLFINIIRHGDTPPKTPDQIQGIVAIDEIDVHLHTDLQNSVLPELIKMFPRIQFIITTHSPLFLLGMKQNFGEDGFEIRNMPTGELITTERFAEFGNAYNILKETEKFEEDIKTKILQSTQVVLFVEGDYDRKYLRRAAELLERVDIINKIEIRDVNGYGNLDKIWKNFNNKTKLSEIISQGIVLLYDCDTNKRNSEIGKVFKRVIPTNTINIIQKGIENLFSKSLIEEAIKNKKAYIDITPEITKTLRGENITTPEKWEVNPDEKGNLCDWICLNGGKEDFEGFEIVFEILEGGSVPKLSVVNSCFPLHTGPFVV
jgi:predicted ATPase